MTYYHKKTKKAKHILNKKGQFLGDFFSGIIQGIQTVIHTLPKPILFGIFLLITFLIGNIAQASLNLFGIFCNSADRPVSTGFNIISNIALMTSTPDAQLLNQDIIQPITTQRGIEYCSWCIDKGTIIHDNGTTENFTTQRCFYNGRGGCVNCELAYIEDPRSIIPVNEKWCIGDAHRKTNEDRDLLAKMFCGGKLFGRCEPPEHYYYRASLGAYVCEDQTCAGITQGQRWNELLTSKGSKPLYPEETENRKDYKNFIGIKCENLKPTIAIYGIPIFDYKIWLFIMLIGIMFWALKTWR